MSAVLNMVGPWLCLLAFLGSPFALAWWLSDGFRGLLSWPGGRQELGVVYNPVTHDQSAAIIDRDSGHVVGYGN